MLSLKDRLGKERVENMKRVQAYGELVGGFRDKYTDKITWIIKAEDGVLYYCRTQLETALFLGKRYELAGRFVKHFQSGYDWITVLENVGAIKEISGPVRSTKDIYSF